MALVGFVDLVVDADRVVLPDGLFPPEPGGAVDGAVGKGVQVIDGAPVADEVELEGAEGVFALPAGLAEDYGRRVQMLDVILSLVKRIGVLTAVGPILLIKLGSHLRYPLERLQKLRREGPKRMIRLGSQ